MNENTYRILGIDIGSNLGITIMDVDVSTMQATVVASFTTVGELHKRKYPHIANHYEGIQSVLYGHRIVLDEAFAKYTPHAVVLEHPFCQRRFAQTFASLRMHVSTIHQALFAYSPYVPLYTPSPAELKMAVGVTGRISSDKELMKDLVSRLPISFAQPTYVLDLDEHSIDAVAACYWLYKRIVSEHQVTTTTIRMT